MLFFVLRGCCSPLRQYYGAGSGGSGSCALRVPRLSYAPAGLLGPAARSLPRRVPRAAQKSLNAKGWPTEKRGRGNQPRPAATVSGDRMQLPGAARCRFPSRWQPHAFCRGAPHKSGSREILSSLKDPSAMHGCGGSAEDEIPGESGRRLRAFFCERLPSSAKSRPPRARKRCFEARSSRLAKHQSSLTSAEHANRSWS